MKLISWNVNGIRSIVQKGFYDFVHHAAPDLLCLQETKASPHQIDMLLPEYPYHYWDTAEKKGYSGTAVFSKIKPINFTGGMPALGHPVEGRICTLEFADFFLVNVYTPNSKSHLERLEYRTKQWDRDFLLMLKDLEKNKPVIVCGDLNVAHQEIDLANPRANRENAGFTPEERESFENYLRSGLIDTFRLFHREGGHYTWWSYFANARARNIGWRIDYFLVSEKLKNRVRSASILPEITGSDHCPVVLEIS
jgi:exodeoxyribonuclease-3